MIIKRIYELIHEAAKDLDANLNFFNFNNSEYFQRNLDGSFVWTGHKYPHLHPFLLANLSIRRKRGAWITDLQLEYHSLTAADASDVIDIQSLAIVQLTRLHKLLTTKYCADFDPNSELRFEVFSFNSHTRTAGAVMSASYFLKNLFNECC